MEKTIGLNGRNICRESEIKRLFDRFYRPLVVFASEYVNDIEISRDIVQDFFFQLWKKDYLSQVADEKIASYLYTAVRNACNKYLSKKDALRESCEIREFDVPVEWQETFDEEALQKARKILEQMPPRTREAIEYVIMKDYSYKAAAEAMGISVNTIKFLLKDGTKKARKHNSSLYSLFMLLHEYYV